MQGFARSLNMAADGGNEWYRCQYEMYFLVCHFGAQLFGLCILQSVVAFWLILTPFLRVSWSAYGFLALSRMFFCRV